MKADDTRYCIFQFQWLNHDGPPNSMNCSFVRWTTQAAYSPALPEGVTAVTYERDRGASYVDWAS